MSEVDPYVARALYDYKGSGEDELSLREGENLVIITNPDENGWTYGYLYDDPTQTAKLVHNTYFTTDFGEESGDPEEDSGSQPKGRSGSSVRQEDYESSGKLAVDYSVEVKKECKLGTGFLWESPANGIQATVEVGNPVTESKFGRKKTFYGVQVKQTIMGKSVEASVKMRWDDIKWFRSQLVRLYPNIIIPPLVEATFQGFRTYRDKDELRIKAASRFLGRLFAHPVLANSKALSDFVTVSDTKRVRKSLESEKREFWRAVDTTGYGELNSTLSQDIDNFAKSTTEHRACVEKLRGSFEEMLDKRYSEISDSFSKVSQGFSEWGKLAFDFRVTVPPKAKESLETTQRLLESVAFAYQNIASMYKEHAASEMDNILFHFTEYEETLAACIPMFKFREMAIRERISTEKSQISGEKAYNLGNIPEEKLTEFRVEKERAKVAFDTVSNITLAEGEFLRAARYKNTKEALEKHIAKNAEFYNDISKQFEALKPVLKKITVTPGFDN